MKRHGEPLSWEDHSGVPRLHRVSAFQFIETSKSICQPPPIPRAVHVNVFSCKVFDIDAAKRFSVQYWQAESVVYLVVPRT